jgi:hypothetical protein
MEPTKILPIVAVSSLVTVGCDGRALLSFVSGGEGLADWQKRFFRAAPAPTGVLLVLALVYLLYCHAPTSPTDLNGSPAAC